MTSKLLFQEVLELGPTFSQNLKDYHAVKDPKLWREAPDTGARPFQMVLSWLNPQVNADAKVQARPEENQLIDHRIMRNNSCFILGQFVTDATPNLKLYNESHLIFNHSASETTFDSTANAQDYPTSDLQLL